MTLIWLSEFVVGALLVAFIGTQIVWPIVRGTELFPLFSHQHRLERELEKARQQLAEDRLQDAILDAQLRHKRREADRWERERGPSDREVRVSPEVGGDDEEIRTRGDGVGGDDLSAVDSRKVGGER